MRILDWLFKQPRLLEFQNQYALNRQTMLEQVVTGIHHCRDRNEQVFVLSHFPATFLEIQEALDRAAVDFDILDQPPDWRQHLADCQLHPTCLSLTSLFCDPLPDALPEHSQPTISVIVTELHPLPSRDRLLQQQIRKLPYPAQMGYYLSLDQPLLAQFVDSTTVTVLKQFGMDQYGSITSELVSRRLSTVLMRLERSRSEWTPADSIEEWLQVNVSDHQSENESTDG